jgi:hypothetical protein
VAATLQALPLYMCCCDELLYITKDAFNGTQHQRQYQGRAWARAEQQVCGASRPRPAHS